MNVSISEVVESRKDEIPMNSKDITEIFLFSLAGTSLI